MITSSESDARFRVWKSRAGTKYCTLGGLKGIERGYEIKRGMTRAANYPPDAYFEMSKNFPKQVALADSLSNLDLMVVVSKALKDFLEAKNLVDVELLPVSIHDHHGRVANPEFFVVNPIRIIDCIDKERSQLKWNPIDPTLISGCLKLVINAGSIDGEVLLFRPKNLELFVFVREDVAREIGELGLSGTNFVEIEKFQY